MFSMQEESERRLICFLPIKLWRCSLHLYFRIILVTAANTWIPFQSSDSEWTPFLGHLTIIPFSQPLGKNSDSQDLQRSEAVQIVKAGSFTLFEGKHNSILVRGTSPCSHALATYQLSLENGPSTPLTRLSKRMQPHCKQALRGAKMSGIVAQNVSIQGFRKEVDIIRVHYAGRPGLIMLSSSLDFPVVAIGNHLRTVWSGVSSLN